MVLLAVGNEVAEAREALLTFGALVQLVPLPMPLQGSGVCELNATIWAAPSRFPFCVRGVGVYLLVIHQLLLGPEAPAADLAGEPHVRAFVLRELLLRGEVLLAAWHRAAEGPGCGVSDQVPRQVRLPLEGLVAARVRALEGLFVRVEPRVLVVARAV